MTRKRRKLKRKVKIILLIIPIILLIIFITYKIINNKPQIKEEKITKKN